MEDIMTRGRPLLRARDKPRGSPLDFLPPNNADYIRDWTMLVPDDGVVILEKDAAEVFGRVDAVTDNGQILWVHVEAGAGRRMFMQTDGTLVWRLPVNK